MKGEERFTSKQATGKNDFETSNSSAKFGPGDQAKAGSVGNDKANPYGPGSADGKK